MTDITNAAFDIPDAPPHLTVAKEAGAHAKKRVWIMLEESDRIPPTGLFIGTGSGEQGQRYEAILRAGVPAHVPEAVIGVLNDAIEGVPSQNGQQQVTGFRNRRRFAYRVLDAAEAQQLLQTEGNS